MNTLSKSILLFLPVFAACGSDTTTIKTKEGRIEVDQVTKVGEKIKDQMDQREKKKEERRKRGDTTAIPYKELEQFLPDIAGFEKKGAAKGETVSMPGIGNWSKTEQRYEGAGGEIKASLTDYNHSEGGLAMASAMFTMNIQIENDRKKSGSFETGMTDVLAYEELDKKSGRVTLTYSIANRFFLQLSGKNGVSADALKQIAKSFPIADLASK